MTWLKKNIARFAPFWVLYILCLLLGLFVMSGRRDPFYFIMNLSGCARIMAVVNCGYALLTAQLLFGDLYDSRMCFGIHSLPMRREELYIINVVSGFLFSLIPTAIMTLCAFPLAMASRVTDRGLIPLLWFAASNLQYVFFFGLAVLCVMCAGGRLSMAVIYGILNVGGMMAYLLVDRFYRPLLPGISTPYEPFFRFFPVGKIASSPLMIVQRLSDADPGKYEIQGGSWIYLLICAAVGILFLLLALQMYRKRALESAGEFIAVKVLRPVFLLLFSLAAGIFLSMAVQLFFGYDRGLGIGLAFAFIGMVVGWFVGLMLMHKTTRVFTRRNLAGSGVLLAVLACSLVLTHLDIFGVAAWVPEADQIEKVYVIPGYQNFGPYWTDRGNFALTEPEDLETVTRIHGLTLEEGAKEGSKAFNPENFGDSIPGPAEDHTVGMSLEYHMKDGSIRRRYYYVDADGEAGQLLKPIFSRAAVILDDPEILKEHRPALYIYVQGRAVPEEYLRDKEVRTLLEAISADCREGSLAQQWEYHRTPVWSDGYQELLCLDLSVGLDFGSSWDMGGIYLAVYSDSTHTLQWLRERGMVQKIIEEMQDQGY